jgi:hypothetical protein
LIAEAINQPIEDHRRTASANSGNHPVLRQADTAIVDEAGTAGCSADRAHKPDRPTQIR